jgi:DNA modification methylase
MKKPTKTTVPKKPPLLAGYRCGDCGAFLVLEVGKRLPSKCSRCERTREPEHWRSLVCAPPAELVKIRSPYNPRRPLTEDEHAQLRASLSEPHACIQDLIINRRSTLTGWPRRSKPVIVGGNQRALVGHAMGLPLLPVVFVDLAKPDELTLNLRLNAIGSDFEPSGVRRVLDELETLGRKVGEVGFTPPRLEAVLAGLRENTEKIGRRSRAATDDDREELPENPVTEVGDLWELGDHRLVCANSLEGERIAEVIETGKVALVLTDPPYAIYGSASGLSSEITDDKIVRSFFRASLRACERVTRLFAHIYIFCDWRSWPSWWEEAKGLHVEPKNLIVWDKGGAGLGSNYANTYELIGFFSHMPAQTAMTGQRKSGQRPVFKSNVIRADRVTGAERMHNAAKPVPLLVELIENSTQKGELVADLFAGSGSTLLACEETGRRCVTADVDPKWCDVTVRRWERVTGRQATRVPQAAKP